MWGKLIPLLLAVPSSIISPASKLVEDSRSLYVDLNSRSPVSRNYSPTIRFDFVGPPANDTSTWRDFHVHPDLGPHISKDASDESIFERVAATHGSTKPLLLYLPGLDGLGISASMQFDDLSSSFEFWRLSISKSDRSTFAELTNAVASFIDDVASKQHREILLVGESFGGLLAPSVAMRVNAKVKTRQGAMEGKTPIQGLVLVNPATSFDDTQWSTFAPLLWTLRHLEQEMDASEDQVVKKSTGRFPTPYSVIGGMALAATIPDAKQLQRIVTMFMDISVTNSEDVTEILGNMRDGFDVLGQELPPAVVEHRVGQWLPVGSAVVNKRLDKLEVPTLVIAGLDDNMLPTKKEAQRLCELMPNCQKLEIKGSGHFVLDERVNLTQLILDSDLNPLKLSSKPYDPIIDWKAPSAERIREAVEARVKPLRTLTSPVFYSTDKSGQRRMGLSNLPSSDDGPPLLFVANHQFGGLDLSMIIAQCVEERGILPRGLAHPILFQSGSEALGNIGGSNEGLSEFETFGAVMVTPKNYYRLMESGQNALLFPGGVREVFHGKDEAYQLFWPEKVDFVRIAARFNATVVPLSAVGAADSVNILIDAPDILKLPFGIGERAANSSANTISARFNVNNEGELFQPPFALPKLLPARHYFVFGKPMSTENINYKDKAACDDFYQNVKGEMQRGFDDVLRAREKDPFKNTASRLRHEALTGKKAATFSIDELN